VRFSAFVQTRPTANSAFYAMGIGSLSRAGNGIDVVLTIQPLPRAEVKVGEEVYLVAF
jgi:hypothetical protein